MRRSNATPSPWTALALAVLLAGCARASDFPDPSAPVLGREGASSGGMSYVGDGADAPAFTAGPRYPDAPAVGEGGARAASAPVGAIAPGQTVHGRLDDGDAPFPGIAGKVMDDYVLVANAGDTVTIDLVGGASERDGGSHLDVYLYVLRDGVEVTHDDDSGGNLASHLVVTLPHGGMYTVRATTFGGSARRGSYTLTVRPGAHPPPGVAE